MSRPSQHKQLMERLDKITEALEQNNAIQLGRLQLEIEATKKPPAPATKKLIESADDQIKAALDAQEKRLNP